MDIRCPEGLSVKIKDHLRMLLIDLGRYELEVQNCDRSKIMFLNKIEEVKKQIKEIRDFLSDLNIKESE